MLPTRSVYHHAARAVRNGWPDTFPGKNDWRNNHMAGPSTNSQPTGAPLDEKPHMGLVGATGVGVGAIVGGGILALAGVAMSSTGPSAIVAFALNGLIAILTAMSFAEMASKFPESGGMYTFARKVLTIEAAFAIGWVVWFASIAAAALYGLGFAHFLMIMLHDLWSVVSDDVPPWLGSSSAATILAVGTTGLVALGLMRGQASGGHWINFSKVLVFGILIMGGFWAMGHHTPHNLKTELSPFFAHGTRGLVQAMGYTFIALQGFDLIAAVGGEVRDPARTIPRAMFLSLAIALAVYLPLLLIVAAVGAPSGEKITELAARDPEGLIAVAARNYLGPFGYWLVIVAAVLAMFSALLANLFAASRIAQTMARDRTLPGFLRRISARQGTPYKAIALSGLIACLLIVVLPDVSAAGAASSLIFLVTFALAHWTAILVRQRSGDRSPPFRTPWFPTVPIVGGAACVGLAVFQSRAVPTAGLVASIWLAFGGVLFLTLFARRARVRDAASAAFDLELVKLRGRSPAVLVPIANPESARGMIALAHTLVPAGTGRLLPLTVIVPPKDWQPEDQPEPMMIAETVMRRAIAAGIELGIPAEGMMTVAHDPVTEITRVASQIACNLVVLGLSRISGDAAGTHSERLLGSIDVDVVVLRSDPDRRLANVHHILVPVAGQGGHDELRARLLGSLVRTGPRTVTFLRVVPASAPPDQQRRVRRELARLVGDEVPTQAEVVVEASDDPLDTVASHARASDLVVLGVQRLGPKQKLFGRFTRSLALATTCPIIVISRKG